MMPYLRRGALVAAGSALFWLVASSLIFVHLSKLTGLIPLWRQPWQWIVYVQMWGRSFWEQLYLVVSGLVPLAAFYALRRQMVSLARPTGVRRGASGIHGDSDWMDMDEALRFLPGSLDGVQVVVGAAVRPDLTPVAKKRFEFARPETWGPAPHAPLLLDDCSRGSTNSVVILPPGGGKTLQATTTIDRWGKSLFVLDPACELADLTREIQEDKGHEIHVLDPSRLDDPENPSSRFNALAWINILDPLAEINVKETVSRVYGKTQARPGMSAEQAQFFRSQGKNLVLCLMAHMLWSDTPLEAKTLRAVRGALCVPQAQLRDVLEGISLQSNSPLARHLAAPLFSMVPETFDGIVSNAHDGTDWLSTSAFADMVSGNDYDPDGLCDGKMTVYCQIPMKALRNSPEIARVIVGSHLGVIFEREGVVDGRVLFLLDEAKLLEAMAALELVRDQARKYKVTVQLNYQSEGQAREVWGPDGWSAWCDSVAWRMYGTVSDLRTAQDLSGTIGDFGAVATSEGKNRGTQGGLLGIGSASAGSNSNEHEVARPLRRAFELMRMRADARIVLFRGELPIFCTAAFGVHRPDTKLRLGQNRFRRVYPRAGLRDGSLPDARRAVPV